MEMEIPVIDLKGLNGDDAERSRTMARLHEACKDWGFFWVDNHGVDPALMEEVKRFVYGHYEEHLEHKFYASDLAKNLQGGRPDDSNHVSDQVDWETTYFVQHHPKNCWNQPTDRFRIGSELYSRERCLMEGSSI